MRYRRLLQDGLLASAASVPDKRAVEADDGSASFEQLLDASLRVAEGFRACGVRPGDRVVLFMENTLACSTAVLGTLLAGGVFVTVNPQTKADRVAHIVNDSEASLLVAEGSLVAVAAAALAEASARIPLVCAHARGPLPDGAIAFEALLASAPAAPYVGTPADLAGLVYTSGTTGVPKGVMLTHGSVLFTVESIIEYLHLGSDDSILNVLQMAFTYGLSQLLLTTHLGATLLLERSFAYPMRTLQRVTEAEVTVIPAVPTMYATIASMAVEGRTYPSVHCLTNAAAGLPPSLHEPIRQVFPNALLFRMYGQTECIRVCYLEPGLIDAKPKSVGKAIPGTEVFILDADGSPVPPGEVGTLHVRGPHVMPGYWRAPKLTEHALREGTYPGDRVLCTHDLFTMDEDGDLYFVARSDEIIKTRGEKVSPVEVENVIFAIRGVKEAAVVGVADERLGEAIRAYVVCDGGAELSERDVIRHCREHLALFAVPSEVVFVDDLPKTPSGKVRRKSLAA